MSKSGFPTRILNEQELESRIKQEGKAFSVAIALSNINYAPGAMNPGTGGLFSPYILKAFYMDNIRISTNVEGRFTLSGGFERNTGQNEFEVLWLRPGINDFTSKHLSRPNLLPIQVALSYSPEFEPTCFNAMMDINLMTNVKTTLTPVAGTTTKFTYTITITNGTGSTQTAYNLKDTIPSGLTFISGTGTGWTITANGQALSGAGTTSLTNGSTTVVTITMEANKKLNFYLSGRGYLCDHDIMADLPPIVWNGTSISSTAAFTSYQTSYVYGIRNYLRETKGVPTRVISKAEPGSTSSWHELGRMFDNRYDFSAIPFAAVFEHGINDSQANIPPATTVTNMQNYIKHWRRVSSKIWVFILAPFPNGNAPVEAKLVILRAAMAVAVQTLIDAGDTKLIYFDGMGSLFNPVTECPTYAPDLTHLNDAGNALVTANFQSKVASIVF